MERGGGGRCSGIHVVSRFGLSSHDTVIQTKPFQKRAVILAFYYYIEKLQSGNGAAFIAGAIISSQTDRLTHVVVVAFVAALVVVLED
jgi:hypothetical protein